MRKAENQFKLRVYLVVILFLRSFKLVKNGITVSRPVVLKIYVIKRIYVKYLEILLENVVKSCDFIHTRLGLYIRYSF